MESLQVLEAKIISTCFENSRNQAILKDHLVQLCSLFSVFAVTSVDPES